MKPRNIKRPYKKYETSKYQSNSDLISVMLPKRPKMNHRTKDIMMKAEINGKRARLRSNMLSIQKPFGPSYRLENERDIGKRSLCR